PFSYIHIYKRFTDHFDYHSHNMFFEILLCYGLVGTAALGSYFVKIVYMAVKNKGIWGRDTLSLMLAVIIAVCIHGLTDYTIFYPQTALIFLLIIGGRRTVRDIKIIEN
ncbi:MAG: hypothetical protein LBQ48_07450, partial [Oscillospiraceae bacterium]|nr:hypothetical protein [Oscillospiraceae bacterium]